MRREYRVLVKDIRGRELGVTRWPFGEAAQEAEPREDVSLSAFRNETPLALWTKEMHEHWDEQLRGADYAEQEQLRDGPDADLAERLRSGVESPRGAGQNLEAWGCLREPATQQAREEPSASSGSVKPDGPTQTAGAGSPFFPGRTAPLGREAPLSHVAVLEAHSQMRTREPQPTESSGSRQDWRGAGSDVWEGTLAEEWDAPHCPLRIREGGLVCLRETPHRKASLVTVPLEGGTPLRAVTWKIKHESIEVQVIRSAAGEALSPSRWAGGQAYEVGWIAVEEVVGWDGRRWVRG